MDSHLVAVEVGVEGGADQGMQLDGMALDQHRLKGLDAQTVQGRCTVEQHGMALDDGLPETSHTSGRARSTILRADLMLLAMPFSTRSFMTKGLNSSRAISLGRPHWYIFSSGPTTITERPE